MPHTAPMLLFVQELLARFSKTTYTEEYKCGECGKKGASNQQAVCRWPRILVLQLARFSADESVPVERRADTIGKVSCSPEHASECA